jgi:hypothetical protein
MQTVESISLVVKCWRRVNAGERDDSRLYADNSLRQRIDELAARVGAAALASGRVRALTLAEHRDPYNTVAGWTTIALVIADEKGRVAVLENTCRRAYASVVHYRANVCLPGAGPFFQVKAEAEHKDIACKRLANAAMRAVRRGDLWARVTPPADPLAWELLAGHFRGRGRVERQALADLMEEEGHPGAERCRALADAGDNPAPALALYREAAE